MATITITAEGKDGSVKFTDKRVLDHIRYYHTKNINEVNEQKENNFGLAALPAILKLNNEIPKDVVLLTAVIEVIRKSPGKGTPTKFFLEPGSIHALCCRPFEVADLNFEVRLEA